MALTYLSSNKCDAAIDVLEGVGRDTSNPDYLQVLASAYACRAKFDTIKFLETQTLLIQGTDATLMKSLTLLALSRETSADSQTYSDVREALNILLNVDSEAPSQVRREGKYGAREAGDMGIQALLLSITQLGKYLHFYGNVNSAGSKGLGAANTDEQGSPASHCFVEYTDSGAIAFLGLGQTGICDNLATDDGHPDLSLAAGSLTVTKRRMCEGLVLVTNIVDILTNISLPDDPAFAVFSSVTAVAETIKTRVSADPTLAAYIDITSQKECEELIANASDFGDFQQVYALIFEKGLP